MTYIDLAKLPKNLSSTIPFKLTPKLRSIIQDKRVEIEDALDTLTDWYSGSYVSSISRAKRREEIIDKIRILVEIFPYIPYRGNLFRAFRAPSVLLNRLREGKSYKLRTSLYPISSWTTSASNASRFALKEWHTNYIVVRLESKAKEIFNRDWIYKVCATLDLVKSTSAFLTYELKALVQKLSKFHAEDEVLLQTSLVNKVTVVLIMHDQDNSVRHAANLSLK